MSIYLKDDGTAGQWTCFPKVSLPARLAGYRVILAGPNHMPYVDATLVPQTLSESGEV